LRQATDADVQAMLVEAGAAERFALQGKRELTKLVVRSQYRGLGLARFLLGAGHARTFTRVIKPFPRYRVHDLYRSEDDPMDSRLIIPDLDIPARWCQLAIPCEYDIESSGEPR
jgi:GNAT superfamily N-acetyltransferase